MTAAPVAVCHWFDVGTGVGPADLAAIVAALNVQASHVSQVWGMGAFVYHVMGRDASKVPGSATKAYLLPNLDVADALGFHDVDPFGAPYVRVGVDVIRDNAGDDWVLGAVDGVSAVCSHEAVELAVDPQCASWGPPAVDGSQVALEACDPCEGYGYRVQARNAPRPVVVSDFVYPAWFGLPNPGGIASLDAMAAVKAPLALGAGGYKIVRSAAGGESEVFAADVKSWRVEGKLWPASRTARRVGVGGVLRGFRRDDDGELGSPRG